MPLIAKSLASARASAQTNKADVGGIPSLLAQGIALA